MNIKTFGMDKCRQTNIERIRCVRTELTGGYAGFTLRCTRVVSSCIDRGSDTSELKRITRTPRSVLRVGIPETTRPRL